MSRRRSDPPDRLLPRRLSLHPPPMERVGNEPANARTALGMRLGLALFGAVVCAAGAVGMLWVGAAAEGHRLRWTMGAVVFAAACLAAVIDLVVIVHRIRDQRRPLP